MPWHGLTVIQHKWGGVYSEVLLPAGKSAEPGHWAAPQRSTEAKPFREGDAKRIACAGHSERHRVAFLEILFQ